MYISHQTHSIFLYIAFIGMVIVSVFVIMGVVHSIPKDHSGQKSEAFCNCFAAQYDGSSADPYSKYYHGGYCYDRERITKLYQDDVFSKTFAGV